MTMVKRAPRRRQKLMANKNLYPQAIVRVWVFLSKVELIETVSTLECWVVQLR